MGDKQNKERLTGRKKPPEVVQDECTRGNFPSIELGARGGGR